MARFHGTSGNDDITGTRHKDRFDMSQGGDDIVSGGGGKDRFYFGGALTANDQIDGGLTIKHHQASVLASVELDGDYSAGVIFNATTMVNVAKLVLDGGHSYNLTTADATIASGRTMDIDASGLGASSTLIINNASDTDGKLTVEANAGHTTLIGGAGWDTFTLGINLNDSDHIDGGGGSNTLILNANNGQGGTYGHLVLGASNIMNFSSIALRSGTYSFTATDDFLTGGNMVSIFGGGAVQLTFDGSAETANTFNLGGFSGTAIGGGGNDSFSDIIGTADGGGGSDIFSAINGTVNGGDGNDQISASTGTINGGAGNDIYQNSSGTFDSGTGDDVFVNCAGTFNLQDSGNIQFQASGFGGAVLNMGDSLTASDVISGSDGATITVVLDGDYSSGITFANTLQNIIALQLTAGHSYAFTADDALLSGSNTMTVDGSALGEPDTLTFDGSAERNGKFILLGGAGDDVLTGSNNGNNALSGGIGEDTLTGGAGSDRLTGGANRDTLDGGTGGNDNFIYASATESTGIHFDTIVGFDVTRDFITAPGKVTGVDAEIIGGALDNTMGVNLFNQELGAAVNGHLLAFHAILFAPDSGSLAGNLFLVVDQNGVAGYQAGEDLVIEISGNNVTSLMAHNFHH